jgi:hypothetical protein
MRKHKVISKTVNLSADQPGGLYKLGCAVADIYLTHPWDRSINLGRPWLYVVVDACSEMITGIHVTFGPPGHEGNLKALHISIMDKVEFCKGLGIAITDEEWPARGLPLSVYDCDGTLRTLGDALVRNLQIEVLQGPAKPVDISKLLGNLAHPLQGRPIRWLKTADPAQDDEHANADGANTMLITSVDFVRWLVLSVLEYNNALQPLFPLSDQMIADGVEPRPSKIWSWGIRNRSGVLRNPDPAWVNAAL